jgi:D-sedoheptulose 7-phosphate isomerase
MMDSIVSRAFSDIGELASLIARSQEFQSGVQQAAEMALAVVRGTGKLLFAGNGGSAAEAQHIAAEYVSRFKFQRPGLPAIALTTDTSILTAISNDYGYEKLFARQLEAVARPGDLLFLSSTSGRSPNVLAALATARGLKVATVLLTGAGYLPLADAANLTLVVPSMVTARIQEIHLMIGHTICEYVEQKMFGE